MQKLIFQKIGPRKFLVPAGHISNGKYLHKQLSQLTSEIFLRSSSILRLENGNTKSILTCGF